MDNKPRHAVLQAKQERQAPPKWHRKPLHAIPILYCSLIDCMKPAR
jgi:hypothetical protein